jgi:hypothetical protein
MVESDSSLLSRFKILGGILIILYIIIFIANFCNFDGWIRVGQLFGHTVCHRSAFAGILAIIQDVILMGMVVVMGITIYTVHKGNYKVSLASKGVGDSEK